jgi:hypothetical protein
VLVAPIESFDYAKAGNSLLEPTYCNREPREEMRKIQEEKFSTTKGSRETSKCNTYN